MLLLDGSFSKTIRRCNASTSRAVSVYPLLSMTTTLLLLLPPRPPLGQQALSGVTYTTAAPVLSPPSLRLARALPNPNSASHACGRNATRRSRAQTIVKSSSQRERVCAAEIDDGPTETERGSVVAGKWPVCPWAKQRTARDGRETTEGRWNKAASLIEKSRDHASFYSRYPSLSTAASSRCHLLFFNNAPALQ